MKPEVLAPAGTFDALVAAVRCGADAVYLGAGKFNARQGAVNFGGDSLREATEYCHIRGVKVYLTLNTLVSDGELADALNQLRLACEAGVDAVIVQDIGLARLIKKAAPTMRLHASTQMSVHTASALPMLKDLGISRVVLARELSATEIKHITSEAAKLGIETEVFVHGALCMCLSGQCYMSGVIGQRSGNRGMCAQPCRMEYSDGSYPLSLKDLSLLDSLPQLMSDGVASLKIEGRMKRPEYVAAAVSAFRLAADGEVVPSRLKELLGSVFSRSGHTDGYYKGKLGENMFGRRTLDAKAESDATFGEIHLLYRNERQSVPVDMSLCLKDGNATLTLTDGEHTVTAQEKAEIALKTPLDSERAFALCSKLGGTPYFLNNFNFDNPQGLTLPASALNGLRRQCCEQLSLLRKGAPIPFNMPELSAATPKKDNNPPLFVRLSGDNFLPKNIHLAQRVYLPLGSKLPQLDNVGVEIPRAMFVGDEWIADQLEKAKEQGAKFALCHNLGAVHLARKAGLTAHLGFGMNIFNSYSANHFAEREVTLSFELTLRQAAKVGKGGIIAYGRLPLMITRNCVKRGKKNCKSCSKELTDRKGVTFPVMCGKGYSEILNTKPLMLSFERDRLSDFDFLTIYFTDETQSQCENIIDCYAQRVAPQGDFTRGLYYRGV
ncbi:MAG: U32 family peptidase [Clostridia bacterium]|nr:U32 family peptidase [Clostridia bacterium]